MRGISRKRGARSKASPPTAAPKPAPNAPIAPKQQLALRLLAAFKAQHPDIRVHCIAADALCGTGAFVDEASAMFGSVQVLSQIRSNQNIRAGTREQHVADYFSPIPGTPHPIPSGG